MCYLKMFLNSSNFKYKHYFTSRSTTETRPRPNFLTRPPRLLSTEKRAIALPTLPPPPPCLSILCALKGRLASCKSQMNPSASERAPAKAGAIPVPHPGLPLRPIPVSPAARAFPISLT